MVNYTQQWFAQDPDVCTSLCDKADTKSEAQYAGSLDTNPARSSWILFKDVTNNNWSFYAETLHIYIYI